MYNIGLVVGSAEDSFSYQVSQGAMEALRATGDNLFIFPVKYLNRTEIARKDPNQQFEYQYNFLIAYALSNSLDAIILCLGTVAYRSEHDEIMAFLRGFKNIPVLLVAADEEGYANVRYNNDTGLRTGIEYLIKQRNCKHICMVSGTTNNTDSLERLNIYLNVLKDNGMAVTEEMIEYSNLCDRSQESIEKLIVNNPNMDAIVCVNDLTAKAAYDVLKKHHLEIGKDVCVLGFDDWEDSAYMDPPLATVRADASELGYRAGMIVHDALRNGHTTDVSFSLTENQKLVETSFINRTSVSGISMPITELTKDTESNYIRKIQDMKYVNHQLNVVTRDMLMFDRGTIKNFSGFLTAFHLEGVESCYLFMLDKPIEYHEAEYVNVVKDLHLQAYKEGDKIIELSRGDVIISKDDLFAYEGFRKKGKNYIVIDIYSRELQYGIMVCDLPLKYFGYIENICFLISLTTKISDLLVTKEALLAEQENMLLKLEQENIILNNISNKDELTGISNRRGFITKAMDILKNTANYKKLGLIMYADLNYLKLINDKYSHSEGNYALQICADALEKIAGEKAIVGRIGGDEFAVFMKIPCTGEGIRLKNRLRIFLEEINAGSGKPYEISMSVGVYEFAITAKSDLKELIKEADSRLYVDKSNKKPFVER